MNILPRIGMVVRVVGNNNFHNYKIGEVYTVSRIYDINVHSLFRAINQEGKQGNWMSIGDVEVLLTNKEISLEELL